MFAARRTRHWQLLLHSRRVLVLEAVWWVCHPVRVINTRFSCHLMLISQYIDTRRYLLFLGRLSERMPRLLSWGKQSSSLATVSLLRGGMVVVFGSGAVSQFSCC